MTEQMLGIKAIVIVPPPPVSLGRRKPTLLPYDELLMWAQANGFVRAPYEDMYDDDGRYIEPNVKGFYKQTGRYDLGAEQFCELYVAEFQKPGEFVHEVFLRGERGFWTPKPFEFACTYEYALQFLRRNFSW